MTLFVKLTRFFRNIIYIRVSKERIIVTNVISGETFNEDNSIGVDEKTSRVFAVGNLPSQASRPADHIVFSKAFDLSSGSIAYSEKTIAALKYLIRKAVGRSVMVRPKILFHFFDKELKLNEPGLRDIERMGSEAGAMSVHIWKGSSALSAVQILNKDFPGDQWAGKQF